MRFERDEQAGVTLRASLISHGIFILIALGLCAKVMMETPPRRVMALALVGYAAYMLLRVLRFLRLYSLWKNAYFEMADDRARGFATDPNLRPGKPFDIPAGDVKKAELTTVPMTQRTPLNALMLATEEEIYIIVGLVADEETRRVFHLDGE